MMKMMKKTLKTKTQLESKRSNLIKMKILLTALKSYKRKLICPICHKWRIRGAFRILHPGWSQIEQNFWTMLTRMRVLRVYLSKSKYRKCRVKWIKICYKWLIRHTSYHLNTIWTKRGWWLSKKNQDYTASSKKNKK